MGRVPMTKEEWAAWRSALRRTTDTELGTIAQSLTRDCWECNVTDVVCAERERRMGLG